MNSDNALLRPTIHLELRLNGLIEEAFLLTARGRQVIDKSLPLRDPIVILGYSAENSAPASPYLESDKRLGSLLA